MKKLALLFTILYATTLISIDTISQSQMKDKNQVHRELLGKVKKLEGDVEIYVGAGTSPAKEQIFFAMEKLDNKNAQIWSNYAAALYQSGGLLDRLRGLNAQCQNQKIREELKAKGDVYALELMDIMCLNRKKFSALLGEEGTRAGINGFNAMLTRQQRPGSSMYVAYASRQPITGPFGPKKEISLNPTLKEFDMAYPDIIISIAIDMNRTANGNVLPSITEHRGIFKNPFFEIRDTYKNISMKLHGWAGTVEEQILHKTYMTVFPTDPAAQLLHRSVKPGDMYIGVDTQPYPYDDELRKKFPPIKHELIPGIENLRGGGIGEDLHIFELKKLSKYYTAQ